MSEDMIFILIGYIIVITIVLVLVIFTNKYTFIQNITKPRNTAILSVIIIIFNTIFMKEGIGNVIGFFFGYYAVIAVPSAIITAGIKKIFGGNFLNDLKVASFYSLLVGFVGNLNELQLIQLF